MRGRINRRQFIKRAVGAGAMFAAAPMFIPSRALGKDGAVSPSERITFGAIGIGARGSYVFKCFLAETDLHCVAVCDVRKDHREAAKRSCDERNGNKDCKTYLDLRE